MEQQITNDLGVIEDSARRLAQEFRKTREENHKLVSLVSVMEKDHKRAQNLFNEHEKQLKERARLKTKLSELIFKLERLKV